MHFIKVITATILLGVPAFAAPQSEISYAPNLPLLQISGQSPDKPAASFAPDLPLTHDVKRESTKRSACGYLPFGIGCSNTRSNKSKMDESIIRKRTQNAHEVPVLVREMMEKGKNMKRDTDCTDPTQRYQPWCTANPQFNMYGMAKAIAGEVLE